MYKGVITAFALLFSFCFLHGQDRQHLTDFNKARKKTIQHGMYTLGGWAISNMAISGFMMPKAKGTSYYFYQMNLFWNLVNLGLSGFGYYNIKRVDSSDLSLMSSLRKHHQFQKILLFNAGLDLAYIASSFYLLEKAKNSRQTERFRGYGRSIFLQGAFLFTFDTILYFILRAQNSKLDIFLNKVRIGSNSIGYTFDL